MFFIISYACYMQCIYCASSTKIVNSRSTAKGTKKWRRRECKKCGHVWTTHEVVDLSTSHKIIHTDNSVEPFWRDKLFVSIKDSLQHRKTALEDASYLTDTILAKTLALKTQNIKTRQLFDIIHKVLKNYDKTAAAVYKATNR